ncbi:MAG: hypothetical protein HYV34_02945 [Candidatus Kerfeldbacteria bacterium]|nr:hypothetical protein [Candidatus Kerfeldbacteria bacterium]
MILFLRLLVYVSPVLLTGSGVLLYFFPAFWHVILLASGFGILLVLIAIHQGFSIASIIEFYLTPPLVIFGLFGFLLFVEQPVIFFASLLVTAGLLGVFLDSYYSFHYDQERFQPRSLANTTSSLNILAMFFMGSALFGLLRFLNQPVWALLLVWLLGVTLSTLSAMAVSMIPFGQSKVSILIISIVLVESFWVLALSPLGMSVAGLVLTSLYYMIVNVSRYYYVHALDRSVLKRYLIIGCATIAIALLSAPWA